MGHRHLRGVGIGLAGLALVVGGACTSEEPRKPATFCTAAEAAAASCNNPSKCDKALASACTDLEKVLVPATIVAAQQCLVSGNCGTQTCVSRAQRAVVPSEAHRDLAQRFCRNCAPQVTDCENQFYARKGELPGGLVLPFSESIADAVKERCTADRDNCRFTFATCASETIAREVRGAVDSNVAECVIGSARQDEEDEEPGDRDGGSDPGPGPNPNPGTECTAENCSTGCCRDDKCEQGTTDTACGTGGAACQACTGSQKCGTGKCEDKCGPDNCDGCCDGDTCVPGTAADRCGEQGAACSACATNGPGFVCTDKKCVDPSCQATCLTGCCTAAGCQPGTAVSACGSGGSACIACGYGRMCDANKACAFDPSSLWDFNIGFASIPEKNNAGAAWDVNGGLADPYLVAFSGVGVNSHTGKTDVHDDTHLPFWDDLPLKGIKASELLQNLSVEVWDDDVQFDDLIGGCKLPITQAMFDDLLHSYTCPATTTTVAVELFFRIRRPL